MRRLSCLAIGLLCAGLAQTQAQTQAYGQAEATTLLPLAPERPAGFQPEQCSIRSKQLRLVATTRVEPASGAPLLVVFDAVEAPPSDWLYQALTYLSELAKTAEPVTVVLVDAEGTHVLHRAETDPGILAAAIGLFNAQARVRTTAEQVPVRQPEGPEREAAIQAELAQLRHLLVSGRNLKDAPTRVQQQLAGLASLPGLFGERPGRKAVVWTTLGSAIGFNHQRDLLATDLQEQIDTARLLSIRWQRTIDTMNRANVSVFVYGYSGRCTSSLRFGPVLCRDPEVEEMLYRNTGGAELRSGATLAHAVKEAASKLDAYYQFTVAFEPPGESVHWTPVSITCKGQGRVGAPKGFFALRP